MVLKRFFRSYKFCMRRKYRSTANLMFNMNLSEIEAPVENAPTSIIRYTVLNSTVIC